MTYKLFSVKKGTTEKKLLLESMIEFRIRHRKTEKGELVQVGHMKNGRCDYSSTPFLVGSGEEVVIENS